MPCRTVKAAVLGLDSHANPGMSVKASIMNPIFRAFILALATLTLSAPLIAEATVIANAAVFPSSPK